MAFIGKARFVALDSAHLGAWARDWVSTGAFRARAGKFEASLAETGWAPFICWHHLEELLNHAEEAVVEARVEFLCALPVVAWVAHRTGECFPGGVIDVVGAELQTALANSDATAAAVRDGARPTILRVGSGQEAFQGIREIWRDLLPHLKARAEDARHNVAITRARFNNAARFKLSDLLSGRFRDPADRASAIAAMKTALAEQIRTRGDRRIADGDAVAEAFFRRVTDMAATLPADIRDFVIGSLIAKNIEPSDIGPETTLGDLDDIGIFRGQMKVVTEELGLPWATVKRRIHPSHFPSWIIGRGLSRFGQDTPERKGSDLADGYLLGLAPYADLTLVDKRALENVRRARAGSSEFARLVGVIRKASTYSDVSTMFAA